MIVYPRILPFSATTLSALTLFKLFIFLVIPNSGFSKIVAVAEFPPLVLSHVAVAVFTSVGFVVASFASSCDTVCDTVYVCDSPGFNFAIVSLNPTRLSLTVIFVKVIFPVFVTTIE